MRCYRDVLSSNISIELSNKAGEIVVLEMAREDGPRELQGIPDDEALAGGAPRDDGVQRGVVDELVGLGQEGRDGSSLKGFERPRNRRRNLSASAFASARLTFAMQRRGSGGGRESWDFVRKVFDLWLHWDCGNRHCSGREGSEVHQRRRRQRESHGFTKLRVFCINQSSSCSRSSRRS